MTTFHEIIFAVVSGSPSAQSNLSSLCKELGRELPCTVKPRVLGTYASLSEEFRAGSADVAWAPPLVAVDLREAGLGTIELCSTRGGQVGYHSAIFTRHASRLDKLRDLKGCHIAWVDKHSAAGYLVPRMHIVNDGLDATGLFGRESFLGTHEKVALSVLDGEADAGATYITLDPETERPISAGWLEAGAGINGAFILAIAGPIPSDAIVLSKRLPKDLKSALVESFQRLPKSAPEALGGLLRADGFAPPPEAHFEKLSALREAL